MMKLTIKARLILSFSLLVLSLVGLGVYSINSLNQVNQQSTVISDTWLPAMDAAHVMNTATSDYRTTELRIILAENDPQGLKEMKERLNIKVQELQQLMTGYEGRTQNDEEAARLYNVFKQEWAGYLQISDQIIGLVDQHKEAEALELMSGTSEKEFDQASNALLDLVKYNQTNSQKASDDGDKAYAGTVAIMTTIIIVMTLIAIGLAFLIVLGITKPIRKLSEAAEEMALGNVNINVETKSKDEIGQLMLSFARMIASIREQAQAVEMVASGDLTVQVRVRSENDLMGKKIQEMIERNNEILTSINTAADQVASGSKQVSDSSIALSQGATEQASSVEELTASLEEISSQTKLNAQNANEANKLAADSKNSALQGNEQMKDMLAAMREINDASSNISKIIKVIDEIAFQTNILALNAAVEAARAGQHGKGFAVVAEEVRNLAARSANAAKETTDMIEGSIDKVQEGTRIADQTAAALQSIVGDIEKVANLVGDIAMASTEQAAAITQINQGISQVSQVIQTNSATSEESAAASEELSSQAALLKQQVAQFKLKRSGYGGFAGYNGSLEELNPEVLRVLENMGPKERNHEPSGASAVPKILLSDSEFGKY
ncbi:MAG: methyl-accepting chemotaxis protein [Paenibacillus macerans]|uniref:methyl-accepting chemotaxis protein n=1 Tax=Paenibacillus macerans TaxID=44252 RepID=UPI002911DF6C|nr:methyl-accepting chemotaxis protein [Paenibacillus macerans]MDU7475821.1 methyl-accepting chemotaxis protein [Paenibacillus macerans]MEC0328825.1 methyl-accepting chemotaxis protein [Paenibacillus macerans]